MKKLGKFLLIFLFIFGTVFPQASSVFAQSSTDSGINLEQINAEQGVEEGYEDKVLGCSIFSGSGFVACFVWIFYYLILYPSGLFAEITAQLLDFFIAYSLDSNSYRDSAGQFINQGWAIIRDIANVLFIFLLLFIAIRHILQLGSSNTKKMLISLIIAALLINFSMFFAKVVIDAGNILGRVFYNNIEVQFDDGTETKGISQVLADKFQPQKLLDSKLFQAGVRTVQGGPRDKISNGYAFSMMAIAAFVNVMIGLTFLSVFLLFLARTIGLWFILIFSPIAFASLAMGGGGKFFGQFGFDTWKDNLLKLAFLAPIFCFFLYLATMFTNLAFDNTVSSSEDTVNYILKVVIPFIVVIMILRQGKEIAKSLAGEFGSALTSAVGKLATFAALGVGGAALGATAMAGRAVIGRGATALAESKWVSERKAKSALVRNLVYKPADKVSKASMDLRNTGLGKRSGQLLNSALTSSGFSAVSAGKGTTKGGYVQRRDAYQKEKEEFKENLKASDGDNQTIHVDANGNVFSKKQIDPNTGTVLTREVTRSLVEAETEFLKVQNQNKREERNLVYATVDDQGRVNQEDHTLDYDAWVKKRDGLEKARKQAETDYANAQRNATRDPQGNIIRTQAFIDAEQKHDITRDAHESVKRFVKNIEKTWDGKEKIFKGVQKAKNQHDTEMLRTYAESIKPGALNTIYDMAVATGGRAARKGAATNIRLAAEKEEKKAIASEKKEDKK